MGTTREVARFSAAGLHRLTSRIFEEAGAPADIAAGVADALIDNHLAGHDSHGLVRIDPYLRWIEEGKVVPGARPEILMEGPGIARVRGHRGFGQTAAYFATELAITKALENTIAVVSVVDLGHTGRLAAFTERGASRGVVMFMAVGSGGYPMTAPHGGSKATLGTNPVAFSVPRQGQHPITLDYATSAIANGKLLVAAAKGTRVPENCIIASDGSASTDPQDYFNGGALLPFAGHKGYALAVIADMLAGPLGGADEFSGAAMETGLFIFAMAADAFRAVDDFDAAVSRVAHRITDVPPAPGFDAVLLPGDPEARARRERTAEGITIDDRTWAKVSEIARGYGIDVDVTVGATLT